jgi:IclR family transcriptional regulator, KDG regulon repressor
MPAKKGGRTAAAISGGGRSRATPVSGAQTLLRALDILDRFTIDGGSLTLAEISRSVQLTVPTTHRLLKALSMRGVVVDDGNRHYSLGPTVMRLASAIMYRSHDLVAIGAPVLERLRQATGETVSLHTILGVERVCVTELVSPEPIRMESGVGHVHPLYAGAAGKVLIAWDESWLERLPADLPKAGPSSLESLSALEFELAKVRRRGFATSIEEVVVGASSLAVPIFGTSGDVVAAINVAGPAIRWTKTKVMQHVPLVQDEANNLMQQLASSGLWAQAPGGT